MAYLPYDDEEERRQQQAGMAPAPSAASGTAPAGAPVAAPPQQQGSRYVGFSQYLNANRDAATRTAGQVADEVDKQGAAAEGAIGQAKGAFGRDVQAGSLGWKAPGTTHTAAPGNSIEAPPGLQPLGPTLTPMTPAEGPELWRQQKGAVYTGPGSMAEASSYEDLVRRTQEASSAAHATGDASGLQALMRQQGMAAATSGGRALDAGLVGAAGAQRLANTRSRYAGLAQALEGANRASEVQAQGAKAATEAAAKAAGERLAWWEKDEAGRVPRDVGQAPQLSDEEDVRGKDLYDAILKDTASTKTKATKESVDAKYGPGSWELYLQYVKSIGSKPQPSVPNDLVSSRSGGLYGGP